MSRNTRNKHSEGRRKKTFLSLTFCLFFIFLLITVKSRADVEKDREEMLISLSVQDVGNTEIPAIIIDTSIYLSVPDLFNYLKIRNTYSHGLDSLSGFVINAQSWYVIDRIHQVINTSDTTYTITQNELVYTESGIYLRSDYFGKVFGLNCWFDFPSLSVTLTTRLQLPVIREKQQEEMRNNINRLKGDIKADIIIPRTYSIWRMGVVDWSVISTQQATGENDTRVNLQSGFEFAGGATTFGLNYDNNGPFAAKNQYYQWQYVNNDLSALRQVMAGKIYAPSISSIYAPVDGVQFTNTPNCMRRAFGTYNISSVTEPGWTVELYVNNVLTDYVKADASGNYSFDVPLVYGSSVVKLRFYGPFGEEKTKQQNIIIPFNFLQPHHFEYNVSAGLVEDSNTSRFSRSDFNYGLSNHVTIGAGLEYLSSVTPGQAMPYLDASVRLNSNIMCNAEYTEGVRSKAILTYHLPSSLQVEVDYTQYNRGQAAINNNFLQERKIIATLPLKGVDYSAFTRFSLYQIVTPVPERPNLTFTTMEGLVSCVLFGVNATVTTYALFAGTGQANVYSNFATSLKLPRRISFLPQLQYNYSDHRFENMRGELGKYTSPECFVNLFYEKDFNSQVQSIGLGVRFNFAVSQVGFSATHGSQGSALTGSARGSIIYDDNTRYAELNNRVNVGKGCIVIVPFLDMNGNGTLDPGEAKVSGLTIQMIGGRTEYNTDTTIRITGLQADTKYNIILNTEGLEEITWKVRNKIMNVTIDPNQFKLIEVPVTVAGEVSGTVFINEKSHQKGIGRIMVDFYRHDSAYAGQALTEADGSFDYTGLAPGDYTARVDFTQMNDLKMVEWPCEIPFSIKRSRDGDAVDGLKFNVKHDTESP